MRVVPSSSSSRFLSAHRELSPVYRAQRRAGTDVIWSARPRARRSVEWSKPPLAVFPRVYYYYFSSSSRVLLVLLLLLLSRDERRHLTARRELAVFKEES